MIDNHVNIFFHGHDHFFARQDADGVVYQLVPQPSHPNYKQAIQAADFGYSIGDILPNSGYLRVTVSAVKTTVDYVRTFLPADEDKNKGRINGTVGFTYSINPTGSFVNSNKGDRVLTENDIHVRNYPNPFNQSTIIEYTIPATSLVQLKVFDISGREICMLYDNVQQAGKYQVLFSAQQPGLAYQLSSGFYFYQIKAGNYIKTNRMLLIK